MSNIGFNTPILFVIFNRPDTTQKVFERIRSMRPKRLFVAADGARPDRHSDIEKCQQTRDLIQVDWDCEVKTLFRDRNVGCKMALIESINWFFDNVAEGIILEDDCLPDPSFFQFCSENLEKYREDKRIMEIVGTNLLGGRGFHRDQDYSYYFSYYGWTWGWATWKRAWDFYDVQMNLYPEIKAKGYLQDITINKEDLAYRIWSFELSYYRKLATTWDYQWQFVKLINQGLSIVPINNLITNIGFGDEATHTKDAQDYSKYFVPLSSMSFPLKHPPFVIRDAVSDRYFVKLFFAGDWKYKYKKFIYDLAKSLGMEESLKKIILLKKKILRQR